jgi:hypothetical protein
MILLYEISEFRCTKCVSPFLALNALFVRFELAVKRN